MSKMYLEEVTFLGGSSNKLQNILLDDVLWLKTEPAKFSKNENTQVNYKYFKNVIQLENVIR